MHSARVWPQGPVSDLSSRVSSGHSPGRGDPAVGMAVGGGLCVCQEHGDRVPPFIPPWELEWQPHTGREGGLPWRCPGARAALQRPLGGLRPRRETAVCTCSCQMCGLFPPTPEGCFCRCGGHVPESSGERVSVGQGM